MDKDLPVVFAENIFFRPGLRTATGFPDAGIFCIDRTRTPTCSITFSKDSLSLSKFFEMAGLCRDTGTDCEKDCEISATRATPTREMRRIPNIKLKRMDGGMNC